MVYVYKKLDKKQEHSFHLSEAVRYKTLWNKAEKIETELYNFMDNNLMFECEEYETKKHFYKAIDELKAFKENLKLKECFIQ